jgi:hypothetical protein
VKKDIWEERFEDIHSFERYMARNGTVIRKFFCIFRRRSRSGASWRDWTNRRKIGSSRLRTFMNVNIGMNIKKPMKMRLPSAPNAVSKCDRSQLAVAESAASDRIAFA